MKITKRQLRRIIKEEKARLLNETAAEDQLRDRMQNQKASAYWSQRPKPMPGDPTIEEFELGKKIEEAIAAAQKAIASGESKAASEVMAILQDAHETLMGL